MSDEMPPDPNVFAGARPKSFAFRRNAAGGRPGMLGYVEGPPAALPPAVQRPPGVVGHKVRAARIIHNGPTPMGTIR